MQLLITIDKDENDIWITECPAIVGCFSQGDTKEQAITNIKEAIALCLEVRAEYAMPLTLETMQIEIAA